MEIKSLAKTGFDAIYQAFADAFADYEIQMNKTQLQTMLKRRGFNPDLSFAAFEGDDILAFTFNGIGAFNGIPTAYDTGTGTLKAYRGQGLATRIFEYSIPYLKDAGIQQYLLEVLQHNTAAVSVYRKLGFEVTREFNYFTQKNEDVYNEIKNADEPYVINKIDINQFGSLPDLGDFFASWQNSFESIERAQDDFICLGVFFRENLVGYCIFEPGSGDITQLAVEKQHRRKGIASMLLREILQLNKYDTVKVINTDISCDLITGFLSAKNITLRGKQFEMIKTI